MKKETCHSPSLNTQSCIKGLLVVWDFCFWVVWAAGPLHKKKLGANYEQLLRAVFWVTIVSASVSRQKFKHTNSLNLT